ncbi:AAA family ATPase [Paraburkholderia elongata]|nr:AAA family ATPase [Paraburkholderia elongata]
MNTNDINPLYPRNAMFSAANTLANGIDLVPASSIPPESIDWLWYGWLARGKVHILAGPPGTGKTTTAANFAAIISGGGPGGRRWPDNTYAQAGVVIVWTGEDGIADTVVPRLIAAGADMTKVLILRGVKERGHPRPFGFKDDIQMLTDAVAQIGNVSLIIIDSIVQAVAGDSNKNSEVRSALAPLVDIAERHNCAIFGITHVNKGSGGKDPLDRINGSLAFGAVARVVMVVARSETSDPSTGTAPSCVLVRVKSNIGPDGGGFEYQIQPIAFQFNTQTIHSSTVRWNETPIEGSAKEILKRAAGDGGALKVGAVEEAEDFLRRQLANSALLFPEIQARAEAAGISLAALKRAKSALRVHSEKQRGAGPASPHIWSLPVVTGFPVTGGVIAPSLLPTGWMDCTLAGGAVAPVAPVAPVEPVEPVEPVAMEPDATFAHMLGYLLDECRREYKTRLRHKNEHEVDFQDRVVDFVLCSVDGLNRASTSKLRSELLNAGIWK